MVGDGQDSRLDTVCILCGELNDQRVTKFQLVWYYLVRAMPILVEIRLSVVIILCGTIIQIKQYLFVFENE